MTARKRWARRSPIHDLPAGDAELEAAPLVHDGVVVVGVERRIPNHWGAGHADCNDDVERLADYAVERVGVVWGEAGRLGIVRRLEVRDVVWEIGDAGDGFGGLADELRYWD